LIRNLSADSFFGFIFFIASLSGFCQEGKSFPSVELEDVYGKVIHSKDLFGKGYVLVGIGTSQKAEDELRTWQVPVYNKYIAKTGLMDQMYDMKVWFIPLFTGASQMSKPNVVKKLRENNEKLVIDNLLIYSGSREPFNTFGVDDKKEPYFLLLNAEGKVKWVGRGAFRQKYIDEIQEIISNE
jgi:hypothetical protein